MAVPLALSAYVRSVLLNIEHILIPRKLRQRGESETEAYSHYGILHGMALPLILYPMSPLSSFSGLLADYVNDNLERDIRPHRRTGKTEKSLRKDWKVEWQGMTASIPVGFDVTKGGLPSIFLMYGTPKHGPVGKRPGATGHPGIKQDKKLFNDVYGSAAQKKRPDRS
jgi:hypothetical protein